MKKMKKIILIIGVILLLLLGYLIYVSWDDSVGGTWDNMWNSTIGYTSNSIDDITEGITWNSIWDNTLGYVWERDETRFINTYTEILIVRGKYEDTAKANKEVQLVFERNDYLEEDFRNDYFTLAEDREEFLAIIDTARERAKNELLRLQAKDIEKENKRKVKELDSKKKKADSTKKIDSTRKGTKKTDSTKKQ